LRRQRLRFETNTHHRPVLALPNRAELLYFFGVQKGPFQGVNEDAEIEKFAQNLHSHIVVSPKLPRFVSPWTFSQDNDLVISISEGIQEEFNALLRLQTVAAINVME
jgi:hypothetical protein